MKTRVAVLFGGVSVEHEISVISALQAMENTDGEKYEIIPVYIAKNGEMYTGEALRSADSFRDIPALIKSCVRVALVREGGKAELVRVPAKHFGSSIISEIDVAFPVVHGTNVEDGALQGYLRTLRLPYVGCDVISSAIGMDKYVMKVMLREGGFPVLPCLRFNRTGAENAEICAAVEAKMKYPVIVKPVNLGSSVGISKAGGRDALEEAVQNAFSYSEQVLIEPCIVNLREINCSVLGDADAAEASECEEPFMHDEILSYQDKYMGGAKGSKSGGSKSSGMASLQRKIPAELSGEERKKIRTMAVDAFRYLGCCGVSRIDFMIDRDTGELFINEFNTIPGSLAFYLWEAVGVKYPALIDRLIFLALKREREQEDITYSFDTNILALGKSHGAKGAKGTKS